jgi:hypothetical protein
MGCAGIETHLGVIIIGRRSTRERIELRAKLIEVAVTVRLVVVPRAGVEPARPFGQPILSPVNAVLPDLTKRYKPVFTRTAVVKVSLQLA